MQTFNELQIAKELIRYPSVTPIDAGVMKFLEKKLKKLGFKTKILEFKEKNTKPVKNLYARLGSKGPNFCYAGHLDVVPAGNLRDWTVNPFRPIIKNDHLIGRGANDMKSSIACFVSAVSKFLKNNSKFDGFQTLEKIKNINQDIPVIMISGHGNIETAVNSIKQGAYDFVEKPFDGDIIVCLLYTSPSPRD